MLVQLLTKSPSQSFLLSLLRAVPLTATPNPFHLPPTYPLPPLLFCYLSPPVSTLNLRPIPSAPLNNLLHPFLYPSPHSSFLSSLPPPLLHHSFESWSTKTRHPPIPLLPSTPTQASTSPIRNIQLYAKILRFSSGTKTPTLPFHPLYTHPTPLLTTLLKLPKTEITTTPSTCSFSVILISVNLIRNITHVVQPTETPSDYYQCQNQHQTQWILILVVNKHYSNVH